MYFYVFVVVILFRRGTAQGTLLIDPFCAWKPPLGHKDTTKGKKYTPTRAFGCLKLCLYGIRDLASAIPQTCPRHGVD